MARIYDYFILFSLIFLLTACNCEPELVVPDSPPSVFLVSVSIDQENIILDFNASLDVTSWSPNTVTLTSPDQTPYDYDFEFKNQDSTVLIPICSINCPSDSCTVQISIKGNGPEVLRNSNGRILDGDRDGTDGGDFEIFATIKSCNDKPDANIIKQLTGIEIQLEDQFSLHFLKDTCEIDTAILLSGQINRDITLRSNVIWILTGPVFVVPNKSMGNATPTTLTIEPKTKLYFDSNSTNPSFLAIAQGAKIHADGENPSGIIQMTSTNVLVGGSCMTSPTPGDWVGLILNGRASINEGDIADGENGTGIYGGQQDDDDSGVLRFVRLEYSQGFSFNGCGSSTTLEYLQSFQTSKTGFKFLGGHANIKHFVSTNSEEVGLEWNQGWVGNAQFGVIEQENMQPTKKNEGIRGYNNYSNPTAIPFSNPTLTNFTVINKNTNTVNGCGLWGNTKGQLHNFLIYNVGKCVDFNVFSPHLATGELDFTHSFLWSCFIADELNLLASVATILEGNPGIIFDGAIGTTTTGDIDPTTVYGTSFFTSTNYVGAVPSGDGNWMAGWVLRPSGSVY